MNIKLLERISSPIFYLALMLWTIALWFWQYYGPDMLGYMGVILQYDGLPDTDTFREVYAQVQRELPNYKYQSLVEGAHLERMAKEQGYFIEQLQYYRIKPLYTYMSYFFNKIGVDLIKATVLPSLIGFFLFGIVLFEWIKKACDAFTSLWTSLFILIFTPIEFVGRFESPDALVAFLLFLVFWCDFYEKKKIIISLLFILLCLIRIESLIFISVYIGLKLYKNEKIKPKYLYGVLTSLGLSSIFIVIFLSKLNGNNLTWLLDFQRTFLPSYKMKLISAFSQIILDSALPMILFFWFVLRKQREKKLDLLLLTCVIAGLIRFLIFPNYQERYYIAYDLLFLVSIILGTYGKHKNIIISPKP